MKTTKLRITTCSHIVGVCLFFTAAVLGLVATGEWVTVAPTFGYVIFLLISWGQNVLVDRSKSQRKIVAVFNLSLFVKTGMILLMFILPGTFGNIHSARFVDVLRSIWLFTCVLFLIANFYIERVYLLRIVGKSEKPSLLKSMPTFLSVAIKYYPIAYSALMFATVIIYTLAVGFVGQLWFIGSIIVYSVFGSIAFTLLAGEKKLSVNIAYCIAVALKFTLTLIFYCIFIPESDPSMQTRVFAGTYNLFLILDLALLCLGTLVDAFAAYFAFRETIGKGQGGKKTLSEPGM